MALCVYLQKLTGPKQFSDYAKRTRRHIRKALYNTHACNRRRIMIVMVMDDTEDALILPYIYHIVYYRSAFDKRRFHPLLIMRRAECKSNVNDINTN